MQTEILTESGPSIYECVEGGRVCSGEDGPVFGGWVLHSPMAVESGSSLPRELGFLPLLGFPEDAERATVEVDIVPAETLPADILWIADDLADATAGEGEDSDERAVADFDSGVRATLIDGVVGAFVDMPEEASAVVGRPELLGGAFAGIVAEFAFRAAGECRIGWEAFVLDTPREKAANDRVVCLCARGSRKR